MNNNPAQALMTILDRAVLQTLEDMAFAEVIPLRAEPDTTVIREINYWSSLDIREPEQGQIVILMSKKLARTLVSSIYGMFEESEITQSHLMDATNEVVNTLCGCLSERMFGTETLFNLGLPLFGEIRDKPEYKNPGDDWLKVDYAVEGWLMTVLIEKSFVKYVKR